MPDITDSNSPSGSRFGAVQPGFNGADRDSQRRRYVGQRKVGVVGEDEDRPLVRGQAGQCPVQLVAQANAFQPVEGWWIVVESERDLDDPSPAISFGESVTRADQQAMEPGLEAIGVAQPGNVAPSLDERLLDCVLGAIRIAQDQPSRCVQSGDDFPDNEPESFPISSLRSPHEFVVHLLDPLPTTQLVASQGMGSEGGREVPTS